MGISFWGHSTLYTLLHSLSKCVLPCGGYGLQRCHSLQLEAICWLCFPQMGSKFFLEGGSYVLHIARLHTKTRKQSGDKIRESSCPYHACLLAGGDRYQSYKPTTGKNLSFSGKCCQEEVHVTRRPCGGEA